MLGDGSGGPDELDSLEGDDVWFAGVLDRFEAALLRYAASVAGSAAAPDIVQDTFLALCSAERGKVMGHIGPWLFIVCKRLALDVLRRRQRLSPLDDAAELASAAAEPGFGRDRLDDVSSASKLVDALPERERQAVVLRFSAGLSYKQIAEVMDLSATHVGVILHTAIGRLRERWAEPTPVAREGNRDELVS
jgi:RNA polymerase sigma factor (sigma-70 family)